MQVDDGDGFGESLTNCPKLETFTGYKLWGLGGTTHEAVVPALEDLDLHRSDDLSGLVLKEAKNLTCLNLQVGCVDALDCWCEW